MVQRKPETEGGGGKQKKETETETEYLDWNICYMKSEES